MFQVNYEVTLLTNELFVHPYSLHYDLQTNNIYFSDLLNATIHRFDFNTNQSFVASIENGAAPTFIIPLRRKSNQFLISDKHNVTVVEWNGEDSVARIVRQVFSVETEEEYASTNWNIAKASPLTNQFYGGTFRGIICSPEPGAIASLYRYTMPTGAQRLVKDLKVAGGIDWNLAENLFYFIDSCNLTIREYNFDPVSGNICKLLQPNRNS